MIILFNIKIDNYNLKNFLMSRKTKIILGILFYPYGLYLIYKHYFGNKGQSFNNIEKGDEKINEKYQKWLTEKNKERKENLKWGGGSLIVVALITFFVGWPIIGSILCALIVLFIIGSLKVPNEADYQAELNEEKANKAEQAKQKAAKKKAEERKAKKEADELKAIKSKFDKIEKNFDKLMSIECPRPTEFKKNISEREKDITSKGSPEYLHKFVKITAFLDDLWSHLVNTRQGMRDDFDPDTFASNYKRKKESEKNRSLEDLTIDLERRAAGDFKDYSADGLLKQLSDVSNKAVKVFPKEFSQVLYLEAMANSMLIFLLEGKQIYFFEILESFDKLGALDSSWQKSVSKKMSSIESKLDILISGISNLNNSINKLIEKNDDIVEQLKSIDSGISANNILQAITAYQVYKVNKQTKGLIGD